jgi:hypothetical protein
MKWRGKDTLLILMVSTAVGSAVLHRFPPGAQAMQTQNSGAMRSIVQGRFTIPQLKKT